MVFEALRSSLELFELLLGVVSAGLFHPPVFLFQGLGALDHGIHPYVIHTVRLILNNIHHVQARELRT